MKQLLALLLVITMLFSLAAVFSGCEDNSKKKNTSSKNDEDEEEEEEEEETEEEENEDETDDEASKGDDDNTIPGDESDVTTPEEDEDPLPSIAADEEITVDDTLSFTVVNFFTTKDVKPPKLTSFYTHYEAPESKVYLVLVMDVKHLGTDSIASNALIIPTVSVDDTDYTPFVLVEEKDGTEFGRGSTTTIAPLQSARLYLLYAVPDTADAESITVSAILKDKTYTGTLTQTEFSEKIPFLSIGESIEKEDTLSATIEDISFQEAVYPPNPNGYYNYYPADEGNVYLVVKMSVTNLKSNDLAYDSIAGLSCLYKEKYNYSFSTILEVDNGQNLSSHPGQYAIAPLDTGIVYYLAEVPAEVQDGPVEITIYIAGSYYRICL